MNTLPSPPGTPTRRRAGHSVRVACALGLLASGLLPGALRAAPLLRCHIDQGGITKQMDVVAVADPYSVAATDINGRFRFKAVVIGDAEHIEYIKLYVYSQTRRQPMLIHQATYLAPVVSRDGRPAALKGINHVYSPQLERELIYRCALLENAP